MMNLKQSKVIASLFVVVLLLSMLTACASQPVSQPQATAKPTAEAMQKEQAPVATPATHLIIKKGTPNPVGNLDDVYLFYADKITENITVKDDNLLPQASDTAAKVLHVFHINDMHSKLMSFHRSGDTHTMAQLKQIVDQKKSELKDNEALLWVSAGDDYIGSSFDELTGNSMDEFVMGASYEAYSKAGVDAVVVGNHEFDKSTHILAAMIRENAEFPVLSSNIFGTKYDVDTPVAAIGVVKGLRIGFIGVTTTEETKLGTVSAMDPITSAEYLVHALDDYCDAFVVLSHLGYEGSKERYTLDIGDAALARAVAAHTTKPAMIVGGHSHTVLNEGGLADENIHDHVPVLQAGQYGKCIGHATMGLTDATPKYTADILYTLSGRAKKDGSPSETEVDYDVAYQKEVIDPMLVLLQERMSKTIGYTDKTELVAAEMNLTDRYIDEAAMANYFNDAVVKRSEGFTTGAVDFSIFNSTGITGMAVDSEITYNDLYNVFPYADTIYVVEMTGQDIKDIVENNAPRIARKETLIPFGGENDPAGFIETGFLHFSEGIRYTIVLGDTDVQNKATDITLHGEPIDNVLEKTYQVAINSYLAIGRGGWQGEKVGQGLSDDFIGYNLKALCAEHGLDLGLVFRNEIISYIQSDCKGLIGEATGVQKDGRLNVLTTEQ